MRFLRLKIYFLTGYPAIQGVNHLSFSSRTHITYIVQKTWIGTCKRLLVTEHWVENPEFMNFIQSICAIVLSTLLVRLPLNENRIFSLNSEPFLLWITPVHIFPTIGDNLFEILETWLLGTGSDFPWCPFSPALRIPNDRLLWCFLWMYKTNKKIEFKTLPTNQNEVPENLQNTQQLVEIWWDRAGNTFPLPYRPDKEEARRTQGVERYFWDLREQLLI